MPGKLYVSDTSSEASAASTRRHKAAGKGWDPLAGNRHTARRSKLLTFMYVLVAASDDVDRWVASLPNKRISEEVDAAMGMHFVCPICTSTCAYNTESPSNKANNMAKLETLHIGAHIVCAMKAAEDNPKFLDLHNTTIATFVRDMLALNPGFSFAGCDNKTFSPMIERVLPSGIRDNGAACTTPLTYVLRPRRMTDAPARAVPKPRGRGSAKAVFTAPQSRRVPTEEEIYEAAMTAVETETDMPAVDPTDMTDPRNYDTYLCVTLIERYWVQLLARWPHIPWTREQRINLRIMCQTTTRDTVDASAAQVRSTLEAGGADQSFVDTIIDEMYRHSGKRIRPIGGLMIALPPLSTCTPFHPPASSVMVEDPPASSVMVEDPPASSVMVEDPPASPVMVEDPPASSIMVEDPPASSAMMEGSDSGSEYSMCVNDE
jgi:hypothetical protein